MQHAVQTSPSDKKSYRIIQLENGLTALLIHDPAVAAGLQQHPQVRVTPRLAIPSLPCEPCSDCPSMWLRGFIANLAAGSTCTLTVGVGNSGWRLLPQGEGDAAPGGGGADAAMRGASDSGSDENGSEDDSGSSGSDGSQGGSSDGDGSEEEGEGDSGAAGASKKVGRPAEAQQQQQQQNSKDGRCCWVRMGVQVCSRPSPTLCV